MSVFYGDACPGISLHFSGVNQHCPFALSDSFGLRIVSKVYVDLIYFNFPFLRPIGDLLVGGLEFH
jgi:hypothetical protein